MQYAFPSDKSVELSFSVGVAGTSASPQSVQLVLEKGALSLGYTAVKTDDQWIAIVDKPGQTFGLGPVKMCINVVLNNRLFTPMKADADIFEEHAQDVLPTSMDEISTQPPIDQPLAPADDEKKQVSAADIQAILGPAVEHVIVSKPSSKLQLLKTIEPKQLEESIKRITIQHVQKSIPAKPVFTLKRTKIVTK